MKFIKKKFPFKKKTKSFLKRQSALSKRERGEVSHFLSGISQDQLIMIVRKIHELNPQNVREDEKGCYIDINTLDESSFEIVKGMAKNFS